MAHGRSFMEEIAVNLKVEEALRVTTLKRRLTEDRLQFVSVANPQPHPEQSVIKLQEVHYEAASAVLSIVNGAIETC